MYYKDVRDKFVAMSGRYDLVRATGEDNGADFFINAGQKFLDRIANQGKASSRYTGTLAAGAVSITVPYMRTLKTAVLSASEELVPLTLTSYEELVEMYGLPLASCTASTPVYIAPVYSADGWEYTSVSIMPPTDIAYTYVLECLLYSPVLSATVSAGVWTQAKSFWTEHHPDTLLLAALYKLEAFYRNTEGAKDWLNALKIDTDEFDKDFVEEDDSDLIAVMGNMQMEG